MRRNVLILGVLVTALVPVLAGCGSSSSSSSTTTTESSSGGGGGGKKKIAGVVANDHGTKTVEDTGKTEVELDDFYFEPTVLQGRAGEKVELELKNEGQVEHSFTIDSQGIDKDLQPGDEAEVTVTIPQSGLVSFYCTFHKSSGMAGAVAAAGTGGMTGTGTTTNDNSKSGGGGY